MLQLHERAFLLEKKVKLVDSGDRIGQFILEGTEYNRIEDKIFFLIAKFGGKGARKGEKECKYWLDREHFDLEEAYAYNMSPRDRREIKKIIFEHFEYIEQQWDEFQRRRQT
ncbi:MAG: DUF4160 domain-containing protein [Candidatus Tectomicrobia bacterium]|nr:DUF4160 domain-containing protein [Candidatus Tectomicrobia bacterium]